MKRAFVTGTVILALCAGLARVSGADPADLAYIRAKVEWYYVPNMQSYDKAVLVNVDQVVSQAKFYPNEKMVTFHHLVRAFASDTPVNQPGFTTVHQNRLQGVVARILRITGKKIKVYLVDDSAGTSTAQWVWPHATVVGNEPDDEARTPGGYGGEAHMGWWHLNKSTKVFPNFTSILWTMCHELMHTQDLSSGRFSQYAVGKHPNVLCLHYGKDQEHFFTEAIPSMALSYKEGIANYTGYAYAPAGLNEPSAWFMDNGYILIEKPPSPKPMDYAPPDVYTYDTLDKTKMETWAGPEIGAWRMSDLPPKVLAHNEWMITLFTHEISPYVASKTGGPTPGFEEMMDMIGSVSRGSLQQSTSSWARLVEMVCAKINATPTPKSLLPIALMDYLTRFKAANAAELQAAFEEWPALKTWTSAYFTTTVGGKTVREAAKDAVAEYGKAHPRTGRETDAEKRKRLREYTQAIAKVLGF